MKETSEVQAEKPLKKQTVTRMAGMMSLGTLTSRVFGFIRDRLIVQFFDGATTDIFYAAFRLPNFFRILLGEGALSVAFVPAYIALKQKSQQEKLLSGAMLSFLSLMGFFISLLGIVFMPQILEVFLSAKNFPPDSARFLDTLFLARIMFFYLYLVSQFAFFMSLLNAHDEFWIPGVAPAAFNIGMIATIIWGQDFYGVHGSVLALGVIIGGILQFAMVFFKSFQLQIVPRPNFLFFHPEFKAVLKRTLPSLVGIGAVQFIGVINVGLASSLNSADITFLYLADRLLELPQSILAVSLGAALLSRLSSLWAEGDQDAFKTQLYDTASIYYFLAIPAAVGLWILGEPMVALLFKTQKNTYADMAVIGSLVQVYAVLLLISGTSKLLLPGFYAIKNTYLPALSSCLTIAVHAVCAPVFMKFLGVQGLVISTTLSSLVALLFTFVMFSKKVAKIDMVKLFKPFPIICALNIPSVAICYGGLHFWGLQSSLSYKNGILLLTILLVALVYFALGVFLKVPYSQKFLRAFLRR